jgi:phosphatidate phosphatase APP1
MKTALTTEGTAVWGMADVYVQLKSAFHYVSAAPYQLLPSVVEFLNTNGFPNGSLHLRDIWVSENMSSRNYKRNVIKKLFTVSQFMFNFFH